MSVNPAGERPVCFQQEARLISEACGRMRGRPAVAQNLSARLHLRGRVDREALARAVEGLVARHGALRARYDFAASIAPDQQEAVIDAVMETRRFVPGTIVQTIEPSVVVDLRTVVVDTRQAAGAPEDIPAFVDQISAPFDTRTPPLIRALFVTDERDEHWLLLTMPHLIGDAWTIDILHRELALFYEAWTTTGKPPRLAPAAQYDEYAIRQHERLRTGDYDASVAYWRAQWEAVRGALIDRRDWPDIALPEERPFEGVVHRLDLTPPETAALRAYARRAGMPLFSIYLAMLGAALRGVTGKSTVAFWINGNNRMTPGSDSMVGWLVNSMIVGFDGDASRSGRDLVEAAHATLTDAIVHGDLPLALYCNVFGHEIHFGEVPISFERFVTGQQSLAAGEVTIINERRQGQGRHGAVEFAAAERQDAITLLAMYDAGQWAGPPLHRFLERWRRALAALIAGDTRPVADDLAVAMP